MPVIPTSIGPGINIPTLQSTSNFSSWSRTFEGIARQQNLWGYFSGDETIQNEPKKPTKPGKKEIEADPDVWKELMTQFKDDRDEWRYQKAEVAKALGLLTQCVSDSYHQQLFALGNKPKEAWNFIKSQFSQPECQLLISAYDTFFSVYLNKKNMVQYIDELKQAQQDIQAAKGQCPDSMVIARIGKTLPKEYNDWVVKNIKIAKEMPALTDLTASLLATESLVKSSQGPKSNRPSKAKDGKDKTEEDDNRPKCTQPDCGRTGHTADRCYKVFPHLKAEDEQAKQAKQAAAAAAVSASTAAATSKSASSKVRELAAFAYVDREHLRQKRGETRQTRLDNVSGTCTSSIRVDPIADDDFQIVNNERRKRVSGGIDRGRNKLPAGHAPSHERPCPERSSARTTNEIPFHNYFAVLPAEEEAPQPFLTDQPREDVPDDGYSLPDVSDQCLSSDSEDSGSDAASLYSTSDTSSQTAVNEVHPYPWTHQSTGKYRLNSAALFAATSDNVHRSAWILDSGANVHIVNSMSFVTESESFNINVGTADEEGSMQVLGDVTVKLPLIAPDGEEQTNLTIKECLYIPSSRCNLISMSKLAEGKACLSGSWDKDKISICFEGQAIGAAYNREGLYHIRLSTTADSGANDSAKLAMIIDFKNKVWQWHFRLGHPSWEYMLKLVKNADGFDVTAKQIKAMRGAICPVCQTTKATYRIPREPARRRATRPGEAIHIDTWGKYPILGTGGTRYMLLITDDFSRYTWTLAAPDKEWGQRSINLLERIQNRHNFRIGMIRLDNEIAKTDVFKIWVRQNGVSVEPTVPYAHYQNGVAERKNRTVRDVTSSITQQANMSHVILHGLDARTREILVNTRMPENLWPWAWQHAVWLRNRLPTRSNSEYKTPWEMLYDQLPDLSREITWGSRVYVTVPLETQREKHAKLQTRAWAGHFIGFESEAIFLVYDPATDMVKRAPPSRVAEREAMEDSHSNPSLRDRIPDWNIPPVRSQDESDDESAGPVGESDEISDTDIDQEGDFDDGASDFHVPIDQLYNVSLEQDDQVPLRHTNPEDTYKINEMENATASTSPIMLETGSSPLSNASQAQDQFFTNQWDIADGDGYGLNDGDDDGRDLFSNHVAMMAVTKGQTIPCDGCQREYLSTSFRKTHLGDLCKKCAEAIPDPPVCSKCKKPSKKYVNSRIGKVCGACLKYREDDADGDEMSQCARCSRRIFQGRPSPDGLLCKNCAVKVPNPATCPLCLKGSSSWRHSEFGKICQNCQRSRAKPAKTCVYCRQRSLDCGNVRPCPNCVKAGVECVQTGKPGQPLTERCVSCVKRHKTCNGERPCNNCKFVGTCYPYGSTKPTKCSPCQHSRGDCDGERPCSVCKRNEDFCTEYDTNDLVVIRYPASQNAIDACASEPKQCRACRVKIKFALSKGLQTSEESCGPTTQTTPCFPCIRNKDYVAFCTWDTKETSIKIPTAP